ncbi:CRISPR-associated protein Cas4 [Haloarchaeobius amylolyticus]|uniref:CRISPR-associated protein Cas4 n=1 Tax=Haloarchaeobius amylolyticus TaxID=1198296 RepID=UPI002270C3C2|nr:CRISPR-associated protein Cas4 [Haloarchaeobius amylolyticus]
MMDNLVNVSDLNQYVYCPRRYWYLHFFDTQGQNYERVEGTSLHDAQSTRGGWLNELYLESETLGLKGKIDVLERDTSTPVPIERKRAASGEYYKSDEIQLAGYCMLLEDHIDQQVDEGAIYLYETDQRMHIPITDDHRDSVRDIVEAMQSMSVDTVPSFTDNPAKCEACSTREYCMPAETIKLEPQKVRGTGWEDEL